MAPRSSRSLLVASFGAAAYFASLSSNAFVSPTQGPRQRSQVTSLAATAEDDGSRRAMLLSGATAGLVAAAGAQPAAADWGVRNVFPLNLPEPSPNPLIYQLQKKSWSMEPFFRQRLYLKAMRQGLMQRGELGLGNEKYFVHWAPDSYRYDILDNKNFQQAVKEGLLLADRDMTDTEEELMVFVYAKPSMQAYVEENLGVLDRVECPQELIDMIEKIKSTPFPPPPARPTKPKSPEAAMAGMVSPGTVLGAAANSP